MTMQLHTTAPLVLCCGRTTPTMGAVAWIGAEFCRFFHEAQGRSQEVFRDKRT